MNPAGSRRLRRSTRADAWQALREPLDYSGAGDDQQLQRRRAEDRFREDYHDACAKTISAGPPVEQRLRAGSIAQIRARRDEQRRQWEQRGSRD